MTDDTLIADLIRAGVSPELVGRVANAIALSGTLSGTSAGAVRQYERDRKQAWREKRHTNQQHPEANDAGVSAAKGGHPSADMSRTVPDNHCDSFFLSSSRSFPEERKKREVVARARGSRMVPDWQPSAGDVSFAIGLGFSDRGIAALRDEFVDYWIGVPGQRGVKIDWSATWRNRARDKQPGMKGQTNGKHRGGSLAAAADDLIARAEADERTLDLGPGDYVVAGAETSQGRRR